MSFVVQPPPPGAAGSPLDDFDPSAGSGQRSYDSIIRANIQTIRTNLQSIEANLRNLSRNFISRRIVECLHDKLKQTFEVILQTENAFKSWLQEQQASASGQQALQRQRDKFLFEKLFAHFQEEIRRVQDLSERVREAAERAADPTGSQGKWEGGSNSHGGNASGDGKQNGIILDIENSDAYGDPGDPDNLFFIGEDSREVAEFDLVSENDSLLNRSVAEERFRGIRRIHSQVTQANGIFKDLANLIFSQGEALNSIETQMQDAHAHSKSANVELRKASRMQQRSRQRRCFLLLFICVLVFLILYSLNVFSLFAFLRPSAVAPAPLRVAEVQGRSASVATESVQPDSNVSAEVVQGPDSPLSGLPPRAAPPPPLDSLNTLKAGFKPKVPT